MDYTKDTVVNVRISIENLSNIHIVLKDTFYIEPHNPEKAEAFYIIQNLLEDLMKNESLKKIINETYPAFEGELLN